MIFAIGKVKDAINAALPMAKNALSSYGPRLHERAALTFQHRSTPQPNNLYAIPESQVLKTNTKTPFRNEAEMMSKLADALSEME